MLRFIFGIIIGASILWYGLHKYDEYRIVLHDNDRLNDYCIEYNARLSESELENMKLKTLVGVLFEQVEDTTAWRILQEYYPNAFPDDTIGPNDPATRGKGTMWKYGTTTRENKFLQGKKSPI